MITVTAFGPFGAVSRNPSEVLGKALFGDGVIVVPVSFAAVDEFLGEVPPGTTKLLMLGIAIGSTEIRLEREGSDEVGQNLDVDGVSRHREKTKSLRGKLLSEVDSSACWAESTNAGNYLCNYIYFEATQKYPDVATEFVHLPPFTAIPYAVQLTRLRRLFNLISYNE